jgi:hypothetical protein
LRICLSVRARARLAVDLIVYSLVYETNDPSEDQPAECEEIQCIDPTLLTIADLPKTSPGDITAILPASSTGLPIDSAPGVSVVTATTAHSAAAAACSTAPVTPLRRTASQILRDTIFGASDEELSEVEGPPEPPKLARKSKTNTAVCADVGKQLRAAKAAKGEVIVDSDNELPTSTPSRPPGKKVRKKAIIISDDEIEEVVSSAKPLVSRRRSALTMAPVSLAKASSTRLQYSASKSGSSSARKDLPSLYGENITAKRSALESPIRLDLDDDGSPPATEKQGPVTSAPAKSLQIQSGNVKGQVVVNNGTNVHDEREEKRQDRANEQSTQVDPY